MKKKVKFNLDNSLHRHLLVEFEETGGYIEEMNDASVDILSQYTRDFPEFSRSMASAIKQIIEPIKKIDLAKATAEVTTYFSISEHGELILANNLSAHNIKINLTWQNEAKP